MSIADEYEIEVVDITCMGLGKGVPEYSYYCEASRLDRVEAAERALKHYINLYGKDTLPTRIYAFMQGSQDTMLVMVPLPLGIKADAETSRAFIKSGQKLRNLFDLTGV
jgi:hypothetical protein